MKEPLKLLVRISESVGEFDSLSIESSGDIRITPKLSEPPANITNPWEDESGDGKPDPAVLAERNIEDIAKQNNMSVKACSAFYSRRGRPPKQACPVQRVLQPESIDAPGKAGQQSDRRHLARRKRQKMDWSPLAYPCLIDKQLTLEALFTEMHDNGSISYHGAAARELLRDSLKKWLYRSKKYVKKVDGSHNAAWTWWGGPVVCKETVKAQSIKCQVQDPDTNLSQEIHPVSPV